MKRLFIICVLVVSFSRVHAVIVTADFIQTTRPEFAGKKFVFYGDAHIPMDEDRAQREIFKQNLLKRDQESTEPLPILIEEPGGMTLNGSVMATLSRLLPPCRNIIIRNAEMRCHLGAAWEVLHPDKDPLLMVPTTQCSSAYGTCRFGDTNIADIDHEVGHFKQQIDEWAGSAPLLQANAMRGFEYEYQTNLKRYKAVCEALSLTSETNMFMLSQQLYGTNQVARRALCHSVLDLGSILFGMHLCKTMLMLKEPAMIVLIAGACHTGQARSFFALCGERIFPHGRDWGLLKPLPLKYLDLKSGFKSSDCCTVQ